MLNLIQLEELGKKTRLINRNIENTSFERYQTFENYDYPLHDHRYTQKLKSLKTLDFMYHSQNILLIGPPGVGKSHIATTRRLMLAKKDLKCFLFIQMN